MFCSAEMNSFINYNYYQLMSEAFDLASRKKQKKKKIKFKDVFLLFRPETFLSRAIRSPEIIFVVHFIVEWELSS